MKEKIKKYWFQILIFIFIWLIFRAIWGWFLGLWITILLFLLVYYGIYKHAESLGEYKGTNKVLSWLEKKGQKTLADSYNNEEGNLKI